MEYHITNDRREKIWEMFKSLIENDTKPHDFRSIFFLGMKSAEAELKEINESAKVEEQKSIDLTKREYFAVMAMQGSLGLKITQNAKISDISMYAVACADELIKELAKTK